MVKWLSSAGRFPNTKNLRRNKIFFSRSVFKNKSLGIYAFEKGEELLLRLYGALNILSAITLVNSIFLAWTVSINFG